MAKLARKEKAMPGYLYRIIARYCVYVAVLLYGNHGTS